ncbi:hypothetical protein [Chryseobacterium sp. MYb328]|uniref:hypothetical protein n=1 Tax=Chryseobacterium sp. MYb328 TaxID=2745231 RepID=UPI003094B2B3
MKKYLILLVLLGVVASAQESFKRVYHIPASKGEILLKKDVSVKFDKWSKGELDSIKQIYVPESMIKISEQISINSVLQTVTREIKVDTAFYKTLTVKRSEIAKCGFWGYVKFDDNKIIANKNSCKKDEKDNIYYYQLKNRDQLSLYFIEGTVSAFTVPIKYRFKQPNVSEEFSSASLNANLFGGISFGMSSFFYRDKVGSVTNNHKLTLGTFVGSSVVELNSNNTSASVDPLPNDRKIIKGLASIGLGIAYSYNKVNFAGFLGWDYAIGDEAEKWNYNKKPWIGIAIGYSLFNL